MRNFKGLMIWQKGMEIVERVYRTLSKLPAEERYGLRSQLARCAVSIPSNIAEGSSRTSQREYKHYSEIALGSCFELETQILIVVKLGWIIQSEADGLLKLIEEEEKMLTSFISKL